MQRTTIMLPTELKLAAQNQANELGISVGKLIRDALRNCLDQDNKGKETDLLFSSYPTYDNNSPSDLSVNHDEYLYGTHK